MDITKDIQPMTTFRNHSAEIMRHLKETKRPVVLTVNGKAITPAISSNRAAGPNSTKPSLSGSW